MAAALRRAVENRRSWPMPAVLLRFTDGDAPTGGSGPFDAAPETELTRRTWPGFGRAYETAAEFDADELEELADYSEEDLVDYVSEILIW